VSKADQFRHDLEATLASLPIAGTTEQGASERRARELVEHELQHAGLQSSTIEGLSEEQRAILHNRCLYYGCQDLVAILAHKRIRGDVIAREEAVLYVQDRLQRDDFRRIGNFDPENRATFKTYIWHVINNLLIDFSRSRAARSPRDDGAAQTSSADAESMVTDEQMRELVAEALLEDSAAIDGMRGLRERLREHLRLTSSERLFLKALFQFDMSIEEVRRLPSFEMGKSEAWRFYYDLMDRLLEAFKEAGVLGTMRALVSESELHVTVSIAARQVSLAVTKIYCVKQGDADSARCHASWQGDTVLGVIEESFPKLKKQLAPWFTAVNPTTLVSDELLAAASESWRGEPPRVFTIAGVAEEFPISRSQFAALRRRFAAKTGR
jgi:hypothetical protein